MIPTLVRTNPIALISDELPGAASDMGAETIFVAGAKFGDGKDGFILLEDRAGRALLDNGHSEDFKITPAASLAERLHERSPAAKGIGIFVIAAPRPHRIFSVGGAGARLRHSARFARQFPLLAMSA